MYTEIKKIYDRVGTPIFNMATTHLMSIGWNTAEKMTDEQITKVEGNGLMTQDFCQDLCKIAREVAQNASPVEFIQFCQIEKLYDTNGIKRRK